MSEIPHVEGWEFAQREIVTTRILKAPRETVFNAWTDPEKLRRWWGPNGFTNTFNVFEPKPGGKWNFVMHGPDGKDYPNESVYVEVVKPARLVLHHLSAPFFQLTVLFDDLAGRTKVTFRMLFKTAVMCEGIKFIAVDGNEQNFDRLEAVLAGK